MPRLIVRSTPSHGDSIVELTRLRTTIGRSARNDLCVEDPFASRLHAEIRRRGDAFWISDLGSANGTLINGARLTAQVQLNDRDTVRIGETEIEYSERADTAPARGRTSILFSDSSFAPKPEATITANSRSSAANLLSSFEAVNRTQINPFPAQAPTPIATQTAVPQDDALSIISRVSLTLLSPLSLEDTLQQVLDCVFEVLSADRGYVMLLEPREETQPKGEKAAEFELVCKALKARRQSPTASQDIQISHSITEQVLKQGTSVLTSDAQQDPRFQERQ